MDEERRQREIDEELDRTTAPVDRSGTGLTDATELAPDRDEAVVNPLADEETDADVDAR